MILRKVQVSFGTVTLSLIHISSGGDENPPIWSRVVCSVREGAVAGVLLWSEARSGGLSYGLSAQQTMTILVAAPFSVIMIRI